MNSTIPQTYPPNLELGGRRVGQKPKLLDEVRATLRTAHYSSAHEITDKYYFFSIIKLFKNENRYSDKIKLSHGLKTEGSYTSWIKQFIIFNNKTHPETLGAEEIKKFITYLANERNVSSSTQNQALNAILFLYKNVVKKEIDFVGGLKYVKRIKHLPVVFSRNEASEIIKNLEGTIKLIVSLLYGSGMRLGEVLSLRVKDIDFEMNHIIVRDGKGEKDRITVLPQKLIPILKEQIRKVKNLHAKDLKDGLGRTKLPYALARKYVNADKEFGLAT